MESKEGTEIVAMLRRIEVVGSRREHEVHENEDSQSDSDREVCC
jgi:hypothetical protein